MYENDSIHIHNVYLCSQRWFWEKLSQHSRNTHTETRAQWARVRAKPEPRTHRIRSTENMLWINTLSNRNAYALCSVRCFGVHVRLGENDGFHHSFVLLYSYTHHARTVSCHSQVWGRNCNRIFYYKWISAWVEWRLRGSFSPEQRMMVNVGREGIVWNGKGHVHQPANGPINRVRRRIHTWWIRFKYARAISLNVGLQLIILCVLYAWWASI